MIYLSTIIKFTKTLEAITHQLPQQTRKFFSDQKPEERTEFEQTKTDRQITLDTFPLPLGIPVFTETQERIKRVKLGSSDRRL